MASETGPELTQQEVAALCDLSTRQVRNLEGEGMPHHSDGGKKRYPLEAVRWYWRRKVGELEATQQESPADAARRRELAARAELREMELAQKRRELMPTEEALDRLAEALMLVESTLRDQPRRRASEWARRLKITEAEALELWEDLVEAARGSLREARDQLGEQRAA